MTYADWVRSAFTSRKEKNYPHEYENGNNPCNKKNDINDNVPFHFFPP